MPHAIHPRFSDRSQTSFPGWLYKAAVIGGTIFLVAIFPFGVGSAFPATLVMAAGLGILYKQHGYYLWERKAGNTHLLV